ncbi:energy transducer TonB [Phenylobacterium soli]
MLVAGQAHAGDLRTAINVQLVGVPASREETPKPGTAAALYPEAARRAGVEGSAVVRCDALQSGDFANCDLVEESPAGQGFGAAALALTPRLAQAPLGKDAAKDAVIPFVFSLKETDAGRLRPKQDDWAYRAVGTRLSDHYPAAAANAPLEGYVVADCDVAANGALTGCRSIVSTPYGWGFRESALAVISSWRLKPVLSDGRPIPAGARIRIPFHFRIAWR